MLLKSHHEQESVLYGQYLAKSISKLQCCVFKSKKDTFLFDTVLEGIPVVGESTEPEQFLSVHGRVRRASVWSNFHGVNVMAAPIEL